MAFQRQVKNVNAEAVKGDRASLNPQAVLVRTAQEDIKFGSFVWLNEDDLFVSKGEGAPLGVVLRTGGHLFDTGEACEFISKGTAVTCVVRGDIYVELESDAVRFQKVFVNMAGNIIAAQAGSAQEGYTETEFFVQSNCEAGSLAAISTDIHP